MKERIARLKQASLEAEPRISLDRARLVTEAYQKHEGRVSTPVLRALAFKNIMENKKIAINPGELIVGERGERPQATPTYPELCCHTLEDLELINNREKISFAVSEETKRIQEEEIIPFWENRSIRQKIFQQMDQDWHDAYQAGIFTEFMEQRAPGHTVADDKLYRQGFADLIARIEKKLADLDYFADPEASDKREELKAMKIAAQALITLGERYSQLAREKAEEESDPVRQAELEKIAQTCQRVPAHRPRDFQEALQMYWFVHIGVISELNTWDAFNPGRLDQHLYPFYQEGLESGKLNQEKARELLQAFWIKFNNQPAPPKVGVTLQESGTYTDFANINVGGLKPDGSDGVNELSYLILDVIDEMQLLQPSSNIQLAAKSPQRFLKRALKIVRKGWGQPSIFNADAVVAELLRQGKKIEDARQGGTSGCVETGAFGKESYILTGYFNLVKILELTLNNGYDPRSEKQLGLKTGDPENFQDFSELWEAFEKQLKHFLDIKIKGNNIIEKIYAREMPAPFLSLVIDDCLEEGRDYNAGGARYNSTYIQGVGLGSITDSLSALKYHVFSENNYTLREILAALQADFSTQQGEILRQELLNKTPRYGNDNDFADELMQQVFASFFAAVDGRPNMKGGRYRVNMLPTTCHVYFGSVIGATPDGRKAEKPLSEGISPVQGADRKGPTAVLKSAAKLDHLKTGGTLLNQKFSPPLLEGESGLNNLASLVRAYFKLDGHHIQFNVIRAETLREAQDNPEEYSNLIVRVAGYSDYFNHLNRELQDEIIQRTEHQSY